MATHGGGGSHGGADQMGTTPGALATLEIAIAGRGATLTRLQSISIHGQTHRAAWFTPLESSRLEDDVQTFAFGLFLDQA